MKPTTSNGSDNPSKSSLSKSMKKSSKSRSKISKSSTSSIQASLQSNTQEAATPTTAQDLPKEKANHRSHVGFGPEAIKVIWEQHDTSDTEIVPDVFPRLAEDVTYKVWELVNNIKTYARHSGGEVTFDLVNEVLKDSDVPPILGASDTDWDKIECDGSFFFNSDHILELRDEYLKETRPTEVVDIGLNSSWILNIKEQNTIIEFLNSLCNGIFLGNEESLTYGLHIASSAAQIGSTLKLILKKCIEMLAFEQKFESLVRNLELLKAISINPYTRDSEHQCQEQLFHLAEIFICLLMGTLNSIKASKPIKKEPFELVKNVLENSDQEPKKEDTDYNQVNVNDIKTEYEALFEMIKQEPECDEEAAAVNDVKNVISPKDDGEENFKAGPSKKNEYSPYQTEICDFKNVDLVTSTMGHLASQFGYFQSECTFLIQKRMEKFFSLRQSACDTDFEFISRCVRGLISLGEYAFREIIPFLSEIDPSCAPKWICNDFSPAAVFLEGRKDIFLHEWLEDLCGEKLQPFMLYTYKYHQKHTTKLYKSLRKPTYVLKPKVYLKYIEKKSIRNHKNIDPFFKSTPLKKSVKNKINFKFAGCKPIDVDQNPQEKQEILSNNVRFNSKIVIAKRKLFKPLSDKKKIMSLSNYCFTQI